MNQGYTLFEMIVVTMIISILTAYAWPEFHNMYLNHLQVAERNRLVASLNFARNLSIVNNTHIVVCPSAAGRECDAGSAWDRGWIVFQDSNRNRIREESEKLFNAENAMNTHITAHSSEHRNKVRYNHHGYAPGSNLSIQFCDPRGSDFAKSVVINNAGRIRQAHSSHLGCG